MLHEEVLYYLVRLICHFSFEEWKMSQFGSVNEAGLLPALVQLHSWRGAKPCSWNFGAGARSFSPDFVERHKEWSFPPAMLLPTTPSQSTVTVTLTACGIHFTMFAVIFLHLYLGVQV